jgi:hypothetical protein
MAHSAQTSRPREAVSPLAQNYQGGANKRYKRGTVIVRRTPIFGRSSPRGATDKSLIVLIPQLTLNQRVPGSSPGAPTKQSRCGTAAFLVLAFAFLRRTKMTWHRFGTALPIPCSCGGLN